MRSQVSTCASDAGSEGTPEDPVFASSGRYKNPPLREYPQKRRLRLLRQAVLGACAAIPCTTICAIAPDGALVQFNDNGFWSWFQDERAIIDPNTGQLL